MRIMSRDDATSAPADRADNFSRVRADAKCLGQGVSQGVCGASMSAMVWTVSLILLNALKALSITRLEFRQRVAAQEARQCLERPLHRNRLGPRPCAARAGRDRGKNPGVNCAASARGRRCTNASSAGSSRQPTIRAKSGGRASLRPISTTCASASRPFPT
jgi:hypothetical protein